MDSYRSVESHGGYTWNRQQCYSRLDYVFMSGYLIKRITDAKTDWAFEQSDHASVSFKIFIDEDVVRGPGLAKVNGSVLDDPLKLTSAKREIKEMLSQIPSDWNPHMKLEYLKVAIRFVLAGLIGR